MPVTALLAELGIEVTPLAVPLTVLLGTRDRDVRGPGALERHRERRSTQGSGRR
jgi:hypothetical protein